MSCYPKFHTLEGETMSLNVTAPIHSNDAVALLYYCGGDEKLCVVQPCSLALTQYQIHIGPLGRDTCVRVPYLTIATWGIARASTAAAKAFAQVQLAEEMAKTTPGGAGCIAVTAAAAGMMKDSAVNGGAATVAGGTSGAPGLPPRPRYADPPPALFVVTLQTKHVFQYRLLVQSERLLKNLKAHLSMAHCIARLTDMPAFAYGEERHRRGAAKLSRGASNINTNANSNGDITGTPTEEASTMWNTEFGWNMYSPQREFTRQMCIDATRSAPAVATEADMQEGRIGPQKDLRPWFALVDLRDCDRAQDTSERCADFFYSCSPTYPDLFLQPKQVDRELLLTSMSARSRARVPAVSYVCLRTGAVLARSSQPLMRSAQLGADSDVCHALINSGYVPPHTQPRTALSASPVVAAAAPLVTTPLAEPIVSSGGIGSARTVTPALSNAHGSLATPAAAAPVRSVRPPSLFDDDEDGDMTSPLPPSNGLSRNAQNVSTPPSVGAGIPPPTSSASSSPPPLPTSSSSSSARVRNSASSGATADDAPVVDAAHTPVVVPVSSKVLLVADCRPQITAAGNAQLGGGYESGSLYAFCQTTFFEIDNVFYLTRAFEKMREMGARYQGNTPEKTFLRRLYDSGWLSLTQRILVCAVACAQSLQSGISCLVHCTDGWDRTSQCTALTMLLMDPYYRTIVGFCTLIEKEFCSFGHKFAERCGHQLPGRTSFFTHSGVASSDTEQHGGAARLDTSPVFLHFLDAVYQVHRQYPTCFEFAPELLVFLSEAVYGCLHGTFLCNGEQERRLEGVRLRTASLWTDVLRMMQREKAAEAPLRFVNMNYDATTAWRFIAQRLRGSSGSTNTPSTTNAPLVDFVLLPNCSSKRLVYWEQLYTREDVDHYLSYNPHVRSVTRKQKVSWGAEFDAFLESEIAAACEERVREVPSLSALEAFMMKESGKPAVAAAAAAAGAGRSAWCVYDGANCFKCYRSFSMWSTKAQCPACKQYFCSECQVHDCILQQY